MASDWIGIVGFATVIVLIIVMVGSSRLPMSIKLLFYLGLSLRAAGSMLRYWILYGFYHGSGDAVRYYRLGLDMAESFRSFDFSPIFDSSQWLYDKWYGTNFVAMVSGAVLTFLGPHLSTEFVVFAVISYVGLVGFAVAFRRTYPHVPLWPYVLWIWLFPSLWYWPSSVGKEAVLMMGVGLAVMGFMGKQNRMKVSLLVLGLFIVFAVRPEVSGVLLTSMLLAQWLSFRGRWTGGRIAQATLFLILALIGVRYAMQSVGITEFDFEGIEEYTDVSQATDRGTSVGAVSFGVTSIPIAAANILFRPFPWEASNVMVLVSSLEILLLWAIVLLRRRNLLRSLRNWRTDRFLSLSIIFVLIYSVALGMTLVNLGIIARQRVFMYPFIFVLLEARPRKRRTRAGPRARSRAVRAPRTRTVRAAVSSRMDR